jgi:two-component system KDP operon response regulator KdpE
MTRRARILIVDDELSIQKGLTPLLASRGYDVESATSGRAALHACEQAPPDLIVLDLGLPDLEGGEVCRRLRTTSQVPIIVLSARGSDADKIAALDLGADDYVTKPFSPEELLARIRVALRRVFDAADPETGRVQIGGLIIDFDRRRVLLDAREVRLTPKEFELLALLARRPNRVLTHHTILTAIWGVHAAAQPEHLWVLVGQLRKKLETDPSHPRYLISEPWVGYRLMADAETASGDPSADGRRAD